MAKVKRLGYNKAIVSKSNFEEKLNKALCCPDCNMMTGNVERKGNSFISTCNKCGLIWETK